MTKDLVIYTAMYGDYDDFTGHDYMTEDADYIIFTDQDIDIPGWTVVKEPPPYAVCNNLKAKYYKIPYKPDYKYSVWLDSNINIKTDLLERRVKQLISDGSTLALSNHFKRNCAYQEIDAVIACNKETLCRALNVKALLSTQNYPLNNGLTENNIIFRDNTAYKVQELMNYWWERILLYSNRDQLTFNYCCWQRGVTPDRLFDQNRNIPDDIEFKKHKGEINED